MENTTTTYSSHILAGTAIRASNSHILHRGRIRGLLDDGPIRGILISSIEFIDKFLSWILERLNVDHLILLHYQHAK